MHALFAIFNILLSSTQTHLPVFYDHNNADGNKLCTKKGGVLILIQLLQSVVQAKTIVKIRG